MRIVAASESLGSFAMLHYHFTIKMTKLQEKKKKSQLTKGFKVITNGSFLIRIIELKVRGNTELTREQNVITF